MSFRDIRSFTEMMRALGYPRLISMENFRSPNFRLVAEILVWLAKRFDPGMDIPKEIDSEQDRVIFIKMVAQSMALKAHIKLNTKKLYQADGHAVKELLKMTSQLYQAMKNINSGSATSQNESSLSLGAAKPHEIKECRRLASEITSRGAALYDLLNREPDLRDLRSLALARQLETTQVEKGIRGNIKTIEAELKKTQSALENIASDEANLQAKIDKKKSELERNQKRLSTLQAVRPAYMDEYERIEEELDRLYRIYLLKFRNLSFLEAQYEEFCRSEREQTAAELERTAEAAARQEMAKKPRSGGKAKVGLDDQLSDDVASDGAESSESEDSNANELISRPKAPTGGVRGSAGGQPGAGGVAKRNFGSMGTDLSDEDDDEDDESGSEATYYDEEDEDSSGLDSTRTLPGRRRECPEAWAASAAAAAPVAKSRNRWTVTTTSREEQNVLFCLVIY
ncbi:hypothetical protein BOX15_Mlig018963g1 [Macrostomum lignano]|uniref:Clusterin-associated protein 1 n=1 Tax=Macrostomum lignano TaxID=282301 RepID=A0A267GXH7_9PLAT|nr:hypothetical protein BOX15_Mlig018963g1 [Macrostomum lignano]